MRPEADDFRTRTADSLTKDGLKQRCQTNAWLGHTKRAHAAAQMPEWQQLCAWARDVKRHTVEHLADYLEEFTRNAERVGTQVHYASTAAEAVQQVAEIAKQHREGPITKGKSMVSEELHLNGHLEAAGLLPLETDLGEYIVQLAGDRPSHIITPVMHMDRQQIGRLLADKLGLDYTDDPQALTAVARERLREAFLAAAVGVTGANFLIADTGSIVLAENEGNIRLCTTLPRVHIALAGLEKLLPRLADLGGFLRLLPRCGTAQKMTGYVSLLTGPRRAGEVEGPEEVHVILLDNGRSALLADPHKRQILTCIRCGACLNACPVYRTVGGHAYDSVYPGPIGKLLGPHSIGTDHGTDLPFGSSLCGACTEVCPVKIDIAHLLLYLRQEAVKSGHGDFLWNAGFSAWSTATQYAPLYRAGAALAKLGRAALDRTGGLEALPGPLAGWSRTRAFPPFAKRSFDQWWKDTQGGQEVE